MMMKSVFWWRKPETSVKLFYLPSADIEEAVEDEKAIRKALSVVPGTMKLHQVVTSAPGSLVYRDVSCMWKKGKRCTCQRKSFQFNLHRES